jgi:hypothetical protein
MTWTNLDHPELSEGWAFPTYESKKSHYFREGRSLCGKWAIPASIRVAGRLDEGMGDDCLTCTRKAIAEVERRPEPERDEESGR